jgi:DNA-3-methyladenine glycosylase
MTRLGDNFFNRDTCAVAKELLGQKLVFYNKTGIITETEAYIGEEDPACHASEEEPQEQKLCMARLVLVTYT